MASKNTEREVKENYQLQEKVIFLDRCSRLNRCNINNFISLVTLDRHLTQYCRYFLHAFASELTAQVHVSTTVWHFVIQQLLIRE